MSKPREFWIEPSYVGVAESKEELNDELHYSGIDEAIHVIEKSAADKLAKALEFYASIDPNKPSAALAADKFDLARKALKEYRGEG